MIKIFEFLFHGCWHDWKETGKVIDFYDISFGPRSFDYRAVACKCTKCGRIGQWKDKTGTYSGKDL